MAGSPYRVFSHDLALAKTVLVALTETQLRELVCSQLERHGVRCVSATSIADAGHLLQEFCPDALLLDIDGNRRAISDLLGRVREAPIPIATAMLSNNIFKSCGGGREKCGADLCVAKPFHPGALIQSVFNLLEGTKPEPLESTTEVRIRRGLLALDLEKSLVLATLNGREEIVDMARNEFRLLRYMMSEPDTNHARAQLLEMVWKAETMDERTVDASVMRLRKRLDTVRLGRAIVTVQGKGYRFSTLFASTMNLARNPPSPK